MMRIYQFRVFWNHLRRRTCHTCVYFDVFWSSGDGQQRKRHAFCRNPASPHRDHPIPEEAWCPHHSSVLSDKNTSS